MDILLELFLEILESLLSCFSFMTHNSENMSLLGGFLERDLPSHVVTCLPLCTARDLKSSQCAVHVMGPVHCTKRKGHASGKIFRSFDQLYVFDL